MSEHGGEASLAIRGISYTDRHMRTETRSRIAERRHEDQWESGAPARQLDVKTVRGRFCESE